MQGAANSVNAVTPFIKNGARTPIAGIVHALTLLVIMLAFGQWASLVPMCSLAAILVVVAYCMSEWRAFAALLKAPRSDVAILLITFLRTILADLTVAVEVGVVLAALTFVKRMSDVTRVSLLSKESLVARERIGPSGATTLEIITKRVTTSGVEIYDLEDPFCLVSADKLRDILPQLKTAPKALVLRLRHVPAIDATGLHALHRFYEECMARSTTLILAGVNPRVMKALRRSHESKVIGRKNSFTDTEHALKRAEEIVNGLPTGRLSMESTLMQPSR